MEGEATKLDPSSESDLESSVSAPTQETAAQDNAASEQIDQHYFEIDPRTLSYRSSSDPNTSSTRSSISDTRIGSVASNRPHKAHDIGWEAIRTVRSRDGTIGLGHFRFLQRLGSGDIGSVYLSELRGTSCYFAMKVMDKRALASRNKLARAQTEKEILEVLDHPFLPTLYAHIDERQFSCLVTEFCPGGDLHVLRQQQPCKRFRDSAARFYAAEVLLAMEYLHMMGIVYRDLKPENVLVREDGHIMLTDFDLSLKCSFNPTLTRLTCTAIASPQASYCSPSKDSSCIQPLGCVSPCSVHPIASCLPISMPRLLHMSSSRRKSKHRPHDGRSSGGTAAGSLPELVVEPTSVRSMSFVGTHEYLAPEIILGEGHGSAVDWWTFGIFLFELLYGKTPFRGADNEVTLMNAITQPLQFPPDDDEVCSAAQDLIRGLLVKDPQKRLAAVRGASEIKQHAFFHGVNWALIRCAIPPEIPSPFRVPDVESSKAEPPPSDSTIDEKKKTWIVEGNPSDSLPDFELF